MSQAKFIIAKYIPDLHRMEPRNVGVIVWHQGATEARFLDSEFVPLLRDPTTYKQWVEIWNELSRNSAVTPMRGKPVSRVEDGFLDAIRHTDDSSGQFRLLDGGYITEKVHKKDVSDIADFLFSDLVATRKAERATAKHDLTSSVEKLFADIDVLKDVTPGFEVPVNLYGARIKIRFTYGIGNGEPEAIFQEVLIASEQNVFAATGKLEPVMRMIARERCGIIVDTNERIRSTEKCQNNLTILRHFGDVIDLSDRVKAADQVKSVLSKAG